LEIASQNGSKSYSGYKQLEKVDRLNQSTQLYNEGKHEQSLLLLKSIL